MCRKYSNTRISNTKIQGSLIQLEKLLDNPLTYIDEEHYQQAVDDAKAILDGLEKISTKGVSEELLTRLELLKNKMALIEHKPILLEHVLDGKKLNSFNRKALLKHVAKTIVDNYSLSKSPEDILQQIFADFTNANYVKHRMNGMVTYSGK